MKTIETLYIPAFTPENPFTQKLPEQEILEAIRDKTIIHHPTHNPLINLLIDSDPGNIPNPRATIIPILENPQEYQDLQRLQTKLITTIQGYENLPGEIIVTGKIKNNTISPLPPGFTSRISIAWQNLALNGNITNRK